MSRGLVAFSIVLVRSVETESENCLRFVPPIPAQETSFPSHTLENALKKINPFEQRFAFQSLIESRHPSGPMSIGGER